MVKLAQHVQILVHHALAIVFVKHVKVDMDCKVINVTLAQLEVI